RAREYFTVDIRRFVRSVMEQLMLERDSSVTSGRVRIDLNKEIENETKATSQLTNQFAQATSILRFKKGTKSYSQIAEVRFGIVCGDGNSFAWQATLVLTSKYHRLDDDLWAQWSQSSAGSTAVGSKHFKKDDTVCFYSRPLSADLTSEVVLGDVNRVLDFLRGGEATIANAIGSDTESDEA
ncbi:MAG TPA: hypothetical protein PLF40_13760, partial [Kofleriaceae bacterium]|nr:hypothetical protein [Kofleriaceae bacterium]